MSLSFSPSPSETTTVSVAPQVATSELHFTATFASLHSYEEAIRDGVRVQLWCNAHKEGKWEALTFEDLESADLGVDSLALHHQAASTSTAKVLHLKISAPVTGRTRFEFTHRLIYPSGHVKWLGEYRRNGVVAYERKDPRFVDGKVFPDCHETTFSSGQDGWNDSEVAQLSPEFGWSILATQADGYVNALLLSNYHC